MSLLCHFIITSIIAPLLYCHCILRPNLRYINNIGNWATSDQYQLHPWYCQVFYHQDEPSTMGPSIPATSWKRIRSTQGNLLRRESRTSRNPLCPQLLHSIQPVFLVAGGQNPATDLRFLILLAGDVESNPGPSPPSSGKCDSCNKAIRKPSATKKTKPPLQCKQVDCTATCHRVPKCSRISRYNPKPSWLCKLHDPNVVPTNQSDSDTSQQSLQQTPKRSCHRCKRTIRRDTHPIQCGHCKQAFHAKCTKLSREAAANAKALPDTWNCKRCISFLAPVTSTAATTRRSNSEKIQKRCKPSIKIVHWNADGLATKVYELSNVLCAKDIDICMIQ